MSKFPERKKEEERERERGEKRGTEAINDRHTRDADRCFRTHQFFFHSVLDVERKINSEWKYEKKV